MMLDTSVYHPVLYVLSDDKVNNTSGTSTYLYIGKEPSVVEHFACYGSSVFWFFWCVLL